MSDRLHVVSMEPPGEEARRWVATSIGPHARIVAVRQLTGGVSSSVHAMTVDDGHGSTRQVVLRRLPKDRPDSRERITRERDVLLALERYDTPSPQCLDADPAGTVCPEPALLMTMLPGRLDLSPRDPELWIGRLVSTLIAVHQLDVAAPPYESWLERDTLSVPSWTSSPTMWQRAIDVAGTSAPRSPSVFIHRDFQQFNVLWHRGEISGVVDWTFASRGSPDVDVAHCRLNLTVLYSAERAEQFRLAYEAASGRRVDPWWDLVGALAYLPSWGPFLQLQAGSRLAVDFDGMHQRVEQHVGRILRRL